MKNENGSAVCLEKEDAYAEKNCLLSMVGLGDALQLLCILWHW